MGGPILIIEDHRDLRQLMREWLEAVFRECEVLASPHGNGAVPKGTARSPRIILVDVDTNQASGVESIEHLKAAVPEAAIIAVTMDDHQALREDIDAAGALACLRKSDISHRLIPLLTQLLNPAADSQREITVVCIEDELEMIRLVELTLERGPFRVFSAINGRQGLEVARRVRPDVVLLDMMMPDLDGWEVAQRLRKDEGLRDVPIIAVSVVHPAGYPTRKLPVDDYLTKPFRADELLRRVHEAACVAA